MATDAAAALMRTFRVGQRRRVTFTCPPIERGAVLMMTAEWQPDVPHKLTSRERRDYDAARAAFLAELIGASDPGRRAVRCRLAG